MTQQKILVTGAAGFLGSHLCDVLLAEGNTVIGVDDLSTCNLANLAHLSSECRFSLIEHDICKPSNPVRSTSSSTWPRRPAGRLRPPRGRDLLVGSAGTSIPRLAASTARVISMLHLGVLRRPGGSPAG